MKPIGTTLFALMAAPALLLAGPGIATAAPPGAPAIASPGAHPGSGTPPAALRTQLRSVTARLDRLRRDAATVRARIQLAADEIPPTLAARFQVRLSQMERSIRELTGKVEDLTYKLKQAAKFQADVEARLRALETGRPAPRKPGDRTATPDRPDRHAGRDTDRRNPPPNDRTTVPTTLPAGTPAEQYRFAIGLLRKARYKAAASAFRQFIKAHPRHRLAGNAHYWLGEAYYVQGDYRQAAILFADGFRQFPKHPKAPAILLKLGMTMAKLNKNQEACATLAELRRRFPKASNHIRRVAAAERQKLGCSG